MRLIHQLVSFFEPSRNEAPRVTLETMLDHIKKMLTLKNIERMIVIIRGSALKRCAGYLFIAAVASQVTLVQVLIAAIAKTMGISIELQSTPSWLSALFVFAGLILIVIDRFQSDKAKKPRPTEHASTTASPIRNALRGIATKVNSYFEVGGLIGLPAAILSFVVVDNVMAPRDFHPRSSAERLAGRFCTSPSILSFASLLPSLC